MVATEGSVTAISPAAGAGTDATGVGVVGKAAAVVVVVGVAGERAGSLSTTGLDGGDGTVAVRVT